VPLARPIKYFGVTVSGSKLHVMDWVPLVENLTKDLMAGREEYYPLEAELC